MDKRFKLRAHRLRCLRALQMLDPGFDIEMSRMIPMQDGHAQSLDFQAVKPERQSARGIHPDSIRHRWRPPWRLHRL
jgi:hypothetical protein